MGYSPWGHKELDTTEVTQHTHTHTQMILSLKSFLWFSLLNAPHNLESWTIKKAEH